MEFSELCVPVLPGWLSTEVTVAPDERSIVDNQGKLLSRIGDPFAGRAPTSFIGPHGLTVDSHGDIYVGEVSWTNWPQSFPDKPRPDNLRSLQKFRRVKA